MSLYSLDSLEAEDCSSRSDIGCEAGRIVGKWGNANSTQPDGILDAELARNPLIWRDYTTANESSTNSEFRVRPIASLVPLPKRIIPKVKLAPDPKKKKKKKKTRKKGKEYSNNVDNNTSPMKNDKKLNIVLTPPVVEAKTKAKSYLEHYRERIGVPAQVRIRSPEGSTLSVFGDTCQESVSSVDSRPPSRTPRDDQSELSFYRRLIQHQPGTTRSYDPEQRSTTTNDWLKSVSDYGMSLSENRRMSYRPYSISDFQSLTVPRADRSLGPDIVETRAKKARVPSYRSAASGLRSSSLYSGVRLLPRRHYNNKSNSVWLLWAFAHLKVHRDRTGVGKTDATYRIRRLGEFTEPEELSSNFRAPQGSKPVLYVPTTLETRSRGSFVEKRNTAHFVEFILRLAGTPASSDHKKLLVNTCRRTNARQHTVGFSLLGLDDEASERAAESKSKVEPEKAGDGEKKTRRSHPSRRKKLLQSTALEHSSRPKGSLKANETAVKRSSCISLDENPSNSSLEDLQRRHQNEKRIIDMMINRTLHR